MNASTVAHAVAPAAAVSHAHFVEPQRAAVAVAAAAAAAAVYYQNVDSVISPSRRYTTMLYATSDAQMWPPQTSTD